MRRSASAVIALSRVSNNARNASAWSAVVSDGTSIGSPERKMPRPNGSGRWKRSQLARRCAPAGGVGDRHDRRARDPRHGDDAERWRASPGLRPSGVMPTQLAVAHRAHHEAQRLRAAAIAGAGDRVDAETVHGVGDDAAVAMARDQHGERLAPRPAERHHQHAAMPERDDEGPLRDVEPVADARRPRRSTGWSPGRARIYDADRPAQGVPHGIGAADPLHQGHRQARAARAAARSASRSCSANCSA